MNPPTPEQLFALADHCVKLSRLAPVEDLIRTYELLAPLMPTERERIKCERVAFLYREARGLQLAELMTPPPTQRRDGDGDGDGKGGVK